MSWYLGFDCATKTFAFSLSYIDTALFNVDVACEIATLVKMQDKVLPEHYSLVTNKALQYIEKIRNYIIIEDGETVDLVPDKKDIGNEITTIERVKALTKYVKTRIPTRENMVVIIENQMGEKANLISAALISLYADYEIIMVSPVLKNSLCFSNESRYSNFSSKYSTSYLANKAHAVALFKDIKKIFVCKIKDDKSHVADSFLQVYAYLLKLKGATLRVVPLKTPQQKLMNIV